MSFVLFFEFDSKFQILLGNSWWVSENLDLHLGDRDIIGGFLEKFGSVAYGEKLKLLNGFGYEALLGFCL